MRKTNFIFMLVALFAVFLVSSVSAQIIFTSQPDGVYNLGDMTKASASIIATDSVGDFFSVYLLCNGVQTQVYQQYINLASGEQKDFDLLAPPLALANVGGSTGTCKLKAALGKDYALSNSFKVSDKITVNITSDGRKFEPAQPVLVEGNAVKENGKDASGIAMITLLSGNESVFSNSAAVTNGFFRFNFSLPSDFRAGTYTAQVEAYETGVSGSKTNDGTASFNVQVEQVPTSLEIVFGDQNSTVYPGKTMKAKAVLHDQTGEKINTTADFTVKDSSGQILDQETKNTDEFLELPISYNSPPATWSISAVSGSLNADSSFRILSSEKVSVDFINRTLIVTNIGNVPYEKPLYVDLGNESLVFNVSVGVDKSQKYVLSAPDGNYSVQVSSESSDLYNGDLSLTGNAIGIEQASNGIVSLVKYPLVWVFVFLILVFVVFLLFRRLRKKKFTGKANINGARPKSMKAPGKEEDAAPKKGGVIDGGAGRADLSLSIQGDKQDASVVCLNLKNLDELRSGKGAISESLSKLQQIAETSKAAIYENGNYLFFIFAPVKTRTFANEKNAVQAAEQIRKVLEDHNRLFKQRFDFGISVNRGMIIAKQFGANIKFMSIGNFSSIAKKLASISGGEVLLSKEVRERLMSDVKTEKASEGDLEYYSLTEVKDRSHSEKFIKDFMNKMERDKKRE